MGYFATVATQLDDTANVVLHPAMKTAIGMEPETSVLAYRNHQELVDTIDGAYRHLGELLEVRADVWAIKPQAAATVRRLLDDAEQRWPDHPVLVAVPRPGMRNMLGQGKPRAAIAVEAACIAAANSCDFAAVIASVLDEQLSDLAFIAALDARTPPEEPPGIDWDVARSFTRVAGTWFIDPAAFRVAQFCVALFPEWKGVTDAELNRRLDAVAEELAARRAS